MNLVINFNKTTSVVILYFTLFAYVCQHFFKIEFPIFFTRSGKDVVDSVAAIAHIAITPSSMTF